MKFYTSNFYKAYLVFVISSNIFLNFSPYCFNAKHCLKYKTLLCFVSTTPLQSEDESINDFEASNGDSEVDVLASYPIYKIELRERENEFTDKKEYRL